MCKLSHRSREDFLAKMGTIVFAAAQIFRSINHKSVRSSGDDTKLFLQYFSEFSVSNLL